MCSRMLVKEQLVLAAGPQAQEHTAWGREPAWWPLQEKRKQSSPLCNEVRTSASAGESKNELMRCVQKTKQTNKKGND